MHAAAVILATVLLLMIGGVIFGLKDHVWAAESLKWLGGAFTFIVGVALGKGATPDKDGGEDETA